MALEKIKVCITGHSGFIGEHLKELLQNNEKLSLIFFEGDLLNKEEVRTFFQKNKDIDQIIHLVGTFFGDFDELYRVNVLTTYNLLEAVSNEGYTGKIIYTSTGAVYGEPKGEKSFEEDPLDPRTPYALAKLYTEECVKYFSSNSGLQYVILRFPNVYGGGSGKGVISAFLNDIKEKKKIDVYGDGSQSRNFLHVSDAVKALEKSIFYEGSDVFNISNPGKVSINNIVEILKSRYKFEINYHKANNDLKDLLLDTSKAQDKLGFLSEVTELKID